jgi:hypothetical protein
MQQIMGGMLAKLVNMPQIDCFYIPMITTPDISATLYHMYLEVRGQACSYVFKPSSVKKTSSPEPESELYRQSERSLLAKLVSTLADKGRNIVSVTDPYGYILSFLYRSRYFFF